jgi:hypothetical protein
VRDTNRDDREPLPEADLAAFDWVRDNLIFWKETEKTTADFDCQTNRVACRRPANRQRTFSLPRRSPWNTQVNPRKVTMLHAGGKLGESIW